MAARISVGVLATLDSKQDAARFMCDALAEADVAPWLVDLSLRPHAHGFADVGGAAVAAASGTSWHELAARSRAEAAQTMIAGGIKLDIRRLRPADVVSIALNPERQEQQNVRKLRGLPQGRWEQLVDLIDEHGNTASLEEIGSLLDLDQKQCVSGLPAGPAAPPAACARGRG